MKKLIFLFFFGFIFIAGCGIITAPGKSININITDMDGDRISYNVASKIFTGSFT